MKFHVFQLILIFLAITMLVSVWVSSFTFNPLLILLVSLVVVYFLIKKFGIERTPDIPLSVIALSFLALLLAAFPLLFVHPFFNSSGDGLHSMITRTLAVSDSFPVNFQPYSEITLTYSVGFHYLPAMVAKFFQIEPISILNWVFGLLFVFLMPIAFYLFVRELFENDFQAIFATVLLLGSKIIFQNFYFGLYVNL